MSVASPPRGLLALVVVTLGLAAGAEPSVQDGTPVMAIDTAPAAWFAGRTANGDVCSLGTALDAAPAGGALLLVFSASWCGACQVELSQLAASADQLDSNGVVTVFVASGEGVIATQEWINSSGLVPLCVVDDPFGVIADQYRVRAANGGLALPAAFLIGENRDVILELREPPEDVPREVLGALRGARAPE